jgi:cytosine/adenosine deaminase-related metal-dependent hydrolase
MGERYDLHIRGGTVLPMTEGFEWFEGDLLIRDGVIADITRGRATGCDAERTLDASNGLVSPGFVQGHVHVVQSLLRHQADEVDLLDWLHRYTWPYEAALDADAVEAAAELGIAELLTGGTTTVLDFGSSHHHDRVFRAAERLGIRMVSGKTHMDAGDGVPPELIEDTDRSLAEAERLGAKWHGAADGRLTYSVAPRFALSCSRRLFTECVRLARANGWLLQTHANENRREVELIRRHTGRSNIEYFDEVGLTGHDVVLAHGVHLDSAELEILRRTATRICHCPGTNLKLASGIADVPRLLELGVPVILGADGAPCNNRLSMFHEMSLAATLHSLRHGPAAMPASRVLSMATRGGAEALHLGHLVGTLEVGKAGDVVVLDLGGWSLLPGGDPWARIVYGGSARDVKHVVVAGREVVVDGRLAALQDDEIRQHARQAWIATRSRMEEKGWSRL